WGYNLIHGKGVIASLDKRYSSTTPLINQFTVLSYDGNNNPIEVIERDGIRKVYLYELPLNQPVFTASNASKNQVYYEGFNSGNLNNGKIGGCYDASPMIVPFSKPNDGRIYVIDYWYYSNGSWSYKKETFANNYLMPYSKVDEIRVYPVDAIVTTFSYTILKGISSVQDVNGNFSFYHYDSSSRLSYITDKDGNITKSIDYHFKGN
ncbi:MAG: hypothetical protein ACKO96_35400, partial [Flammeovirgaceae bacterium]